MRFRSFAVLLGTVLVTVLGDLRTVEAQTVPDVVWVAAPLADALGDLTEQTGVEFVFALRLVRDGRASGRYGRRLYRHDRRPCCARAGHPLYIDHAYVHRGEPRFDGRGDKDYDPRRIRRDYQEQDSGEAVDRGLQIRDT